MRLSVCFLAFIYLSASGCISLTEAQILERDTQRAYDAENWQVCDMIFRRYGVPTTHNGHKHGDNDLIRPWMIRADLLDNNCKTIIKDDYWVD